MKATNRGSGMGFGSARQHPSRRAMARRELRRMVGSHLDHLRTSSRGCDPSGRSSSSATRSWIPSRRNSSLRGQAVNTSSSSRRRSRINSSRSASLMSTSARRPIIAASTEARPYLISSSLDLITSMMRANARGRNERRCRSSEPGNNVSFADGLYPDVYRSPFTLDLPRSVCSKRLAPDCSFLADIIRVRAGKGGLVANESRKNQCW